MNYDFEIEKIVNKINSNKYKVILLQFPEGLKPESTRIANEIEKKTKCKVLIWGGSCYGACDIPNLKVDLIVQFGHSELIVK